MKAVFTLVGIAAAAFTADTASAGVTLTSQGKEHSVIYLDGNRVRIESRKDPNGPEEISIYDGDNQKLITLIPDRKAYAETTPESKRATTSRLKELMAQMPPEQRAQMEAAAKTDPEKRKQFEELMSGRSEASSKSDKVQPHKDEFKWERTGSHQTVAGHRCEWFKQLTNGKLNAQVCYIPWNAGVITKADLAPMIKMLQMLLEASGVHSDKAFEALLDAPGYPAISEPATSNGAAGDKETLISVKYESLSAEKFQPPAGFVKMDMFGSSDLIR